MIASVDRLRRRLAAPVDAAGLVWFRVVFGLVVVWEMFRHLWRGRVTTYWVEPELLLPYWPFTFVRPLPEPWTTAHVLMVLLAGAAVAAGWRYRVYTWVSFVGFTWLFLLDQSRYLNHNYLVVLLSFVLCCVPAHRLWSVDARTGVAERSETVPAWTLWWVRFLIGVPYFFGGLAKINHDWLRGEPMRSWLARSTDYPIIGRWFDTEPAVLFFVAGGLLFDLLIVPILLVRRTRVLGIGLMLAFHLLNCRMFKIGIFPYLMIVATLVFLPPDWPRRVWSDLTSPVLRRRLPLLVGGAVGFAVGATLPSQPDPVNAVIAAIGVAVFAWEVANYGWDLDRPSAPEPASTPVPAVTFAGLSAFVAVQVALPLRHLLIPGDVHWTEEGHQWAWHMKLRDKDAVGVFVVDPPGPTAPFEVDPYDHLHPFQAKKVLQTPVLTVMFGQWLVEHLDVPGAAVYVRSEVSLNGRARTPMIDPDQDLTTIRVPWVPPAPWILPPSDDPPGAVARRDHGKALQTSVDD